MQVPRIMWGAMFASTVMFLVVLLVVKPQQTPDNALLLGLGAVALITAALSFAIPRNLHIQALARTKLEISEEPDESGMPMPGNPRTRRVFANPKQAATRAIMLWQTPFILSLALSESVSIYGFVLGFVGFPLPVVLPFFVVSWLLFAVRFPTESKVLNPLIRVKRAHFPKAKG